MLNLKNYKKFEPRFLLFLFPLVIAFFLLIFCQTAFGAVWYVAGDVTNSGNGKSWSEAFKTIQEAVDAADIWDNEIWVKGGIYLLSSQIEVYKDVTMYGGFAGWETRVEQRDWYNHSTIIDGNNAVRCFNISSSVMIDGLIIRNGHTAESGGGVCVDIYRATIINCTFSGNNSGIDGGAIYSHEATLKITNCAFGGNIAARYGGGIYHEMYYSGIRNPSITNCTFYNNTAGSYGGGMWFSHSVTWNQTSAGIKNCIVWGNNAPNNPGIGHTSYVIPVITYCDIQGGYLGEGNIDEDPLFSDEQGRLSNGSPCIDAGSNNLSYILTHDIDGKYRVLDGDGNGTSFTDMGAYEYGIALISPNGGECWWAETNRSINWKSSMAGIGAFVKIEISRNGGSTWDTIVSNTENNGSYEWDVAPPSSTNCLIRISSVEHPSVKDDSNSLFTIENDYDDDGMGDTWEMKFFSNYNRDGTLDWDGDGLNDKNEFYYGTNPKILDTDGDDKSDGEEIATGSNPLVGIWGMTLVDKKFIGVIGSRGGKYSSIAVDSSDNIHISYYNDAPNRYYTESPLSLEYATNTSGVWVVTAVDVEGDVGQYTSIAVDSMNKVHISYYDVTNSDLKYATNTSGSWVTTTLDSEGDVGSYTSITVDSNDKIHISYYDETNGDLKYVTNTSGSWVTATVDNEGDVGSYTSIAMDSMNKVHISYHDVTNSNLKYATDSSGSWVVTMVDGDVSVGLYTSIKTDSDNGAHIAYYDDYNNNLKYATNASGSWVTSAIDGEGDVGKATSIDIDSRDNVHISYYDDTNDNLKYANNSSGSWVLLTVHSEDDGAVGSYASIAADSKDNIHLSYTYEYAVDTWQPPDQCHLVYANNVPFTYDLSGTWFAHITGNWVAGCPDCIVDENEQMTVDINQNGKMVIIKADNYIFCGMVSGNKYTLSTMYFESPEDRIITPPGDTWYFDGVTTRDVYFIASSSNSKAEGTSTWSYNLEDPDGDACNGGANISLTKTDGTTPEQPSGGGGSGGGSCFIDTAAYGFHMAQ